LENGLLFLAILWDITKLVLAAAPLDMQRLVKQPCCFCSLASKASKKATTKIAFIIKAVQLYSIIIIIIYFLYSYLHLIMNSPPT
jgi:hypothetical protein